jgi:death-on-curing family protein
MNITQKDIINWNKLLTLKSKEPHGQLKQGIEAAIHRTEYYDTPIEKAAALFHSLINNHYFLQANKRTALVGLLVVLSNAEFDDEFLEKLIIDTSQNNLDVPDIVSRLKNKIKINDSLKETINNILNKYELLIEKLYYI